MENLKEILSRYEQWKNQTLADEDLTAELLSVAGSESEIAERFVKDLEFGTGGLRGIIGVGTNRMNIYTVARATKGLANYIENAGLQKRVAIGFDSRNKSVMFSRAAAAVLANSGFEVHLYKELCATPMVSFAVRELDCAAGVMITASHNPAKYNGYKAYGSDGCQMTDNSANAVTAEIAKLPVFGACDLSGFDKALQSGAVKYITDETIDTYYRCVIAQQLCPDVLNGTDLNIVYTPLNGAGNVPVRHVLQRCGIGGVTVVKEQELPDGDFPTCTYPNPESREALKLGIEYCNKTGADLLLATDPDCDRVGTAVKCGDDYVLPTGNEMALLLLHYILTVKKQNGTMQDRPVFVKSIVTTRLAKTMAEKNGVECRDVLTGFKYIGEQILYLEQAGEVQRFLMGCEESYGYLVGSYARDKDAVVASLLIVEMAAYFKKLGKSLVDVLEEIYRNYGYEINSVDSFEFEGISGLATMKNIMASLRDTIPTSLDDETVLTYSDYLKGVAIDIATKSETVIDLPKSDIVQFDCGNCSVIVRPSGTEPKIKVYYSACCATKEQSQQTIQKLRTYVKNMLAV